MNEHPAAAQPSASDPAPESNEAVLPTQHPLRVAGALAVALVLGIASVWACEKLRYEEFVGVIEARTHKLSLEHDARLAELLVKEGAQVDAGETLAILLDESLDLKLQKQATLITQVEAELAQLNGRVGLELEWKRRDIDANLFETKLRLAEILRQRFQSDIESIAWNDVSQSLEQSLSSPPEGGALPRMITLAESDDRKVRARVRKESAINIREVTTVQHDLCESRLTELSRLRDQLVEQVSAAHGVGTVQARLEREKLELAALEKTKAALTLVASQSGLVGRIKGQPGDRVAAHDTIVELIQEESPYLVLNVPPSRIDDFQPGAVVEICFPGQGKRQGRVTHVPPQADATRTTETGAAMITAIVEPKGKLWPTIPFGTTLKVKRLR